LCDRHDLGAQSFIGRVERHRQLGTDWLDAEVGDARDDPRSRNRHARFWNANRLDQQSHGFHEVVVVQERLALAHEDQIYAVALQVDLLIVEDSKYLTDDFASAEVALESEQRGHAESTLHGATNLAGDTDSGPVPALLRWGGFARS